MSERCDIKENYFQLWFPFSFSFFFFFTLKIVAAEKCLLCFPAELAPLRPAQTANIAAEVIHHFKVFLQ